MKIWIKWIRISKKSFWVHPTHLNNKIQQKSWWHLKSKTLWKNPETYLCRQVSIHFQFISRSLSRLQQSHKMLLRTRLINYRPVSTNRRTSLPKLMVRLRTALALHQFSAAFQVDTARNILQDHQVSTHSKFQLIRVPDQLKTTHTEIPKFQMATQAARRWTPQMLTNSLGASKK